MDKKPGTSKDGADKQVRGIKRKTRKHYSAEEKIRVVLDGLRLSIVHPGPDRSGAASRTRFARMWSTLRGKTKT